jgi:hypothetical protein
LDEGQSKLNIDQTPCSLGFTQQELPRRQKYKFKESLVYYQSRASDVKIEQTSTPSWPAELTYTNKETHFTTNLDCIRYLHEGHRIRKHWGGGLCMFLFQLRNHQTDFD